MTGLFELLISLWNLWTKIEQKVKCPHLHTYVLCYSNHHIKVYQDKNVLKSKIIKQLSLHVLQCVFHIKLFRVSNSYPQSNSMTFAYQHDQFYISTNQMSV
jgi:hypothetical protein